MLEFISRRTLLTASAGMALGIVMRPAWAALPALKKKNSYKNENKKRSAQSDI